MMTMNETETLDGELQLKDLDFVESDREKHESLPAALCDDLLLVEIKNIPDKMGFKIGDVAELLEIKPYVLRYWETEFDILKPKKATNNQRLYTRKDVENAYVIRKLLHRDRFSIEGARIAMKELKNHVKKEKDYTQVVQKFQSLSVDFYERLENLADDVRKLRQLFK
jgi:DNA-binding transcriptional MerR regulator